MVQNETIVATINGSSLSMPAASTVADVVRKLGALPEKVVVERNLEIVPREAMETTPIAAGDSIEVIQFVGGG